MPQIRLDQGAPCRQKRCQNIGGIDGKAGSHLCPDCGRCPNCQGHGVNGHPKQAPCPRGCGYGWLACGATDEQVDLLQRYGKTPKDQRKAILLAMRSCAIRRARLGRPVSGRYNLEAGK